MIDPTIYGLRSSPLKDKNQFDQDVIRSHGIQVSIGACEMQGWRKSMEDRHLIQRINFGPNCDLVLFCIFDGHGGAEVAEFCKTSFSQFLIQKIRRSGAEVNFSHEFFENIFLEFDQNILSDEKNMGGTTVCVCIINLAVSKLFMAHMGDSRALIFHPGSERLLYQTTDHTPTEPAEIHRITCIAKTQITQGRVWSVSGKHSINVTRGLGDRLFKKSSVHLPREQPVCSVCDYFTLDLKEVLNSIRLAQASDSEVAVANSICIYMASDGIWSARFDQSQLKSLPGYPHRLLNENINQEIIQWTRFHSLRPIFDPTSRPRSRQKSKSRIPRYAFASSIAASFDHLIATFFPQKDKSTDNMTAILILAQLTNLADTAVPPPICSKDAKTSSDAMPSCGESPSSRPLSISFDLEKKNCREELHAIAAEVTPDSTVPEMKRKKRKRKVVPKEASEPLQDSKTPKLDIPPEGKVKKPASKTTSRRSKRSRSDPAATIDISPVNVRTRRARKGAS